MKRASVLTAMFRSSWFGKLARRTGGARVKQPSVIWVDVQLTRDFFLCYCSCHERANRAFVAYVFMHLLYSMKVTINVKK